MTISTTSLNMLNLKKVLGVTRNPNKNLFDLFFSEHGLVLA